LLYNRGTLYAQQQEYQKAIEDFTRAIAIDANLAEAYYNRGICAINIKQNEAAVRDLGKAGELGLYTAYSINKKYRN
jgi:tetratricopeptide (TPR) repeat protein